MLESRMLSKSTAIVGSSLWITRIGMRHRSNGHLTVSLRLSVLAQLFMASSASNILDRVFSSCAKDPKGSIHRAWGISLIFVIIFFVIAVFESESPEMLLAYSHVFSSHKPAHEWWGQGFSNCGYLDRHCSRRPWRSGNVRLEAIPHIFQRRFLSRGPGYPCESKSDHVWNLPWLQSRQSEHKSHLFQFRLCSLHDTDVL